MQHPSRYPADAFRGFRAALPDLVVGLTTALDQTRAVKLLELQPGQTVVDVSCASGFNLRRLVGAVGPAGCVIAVEDNAHVLRRAQKKARAARWTNVRFVAEIAAAGLVEQVDGVIVSYDPPIILQRPDLLDAAWAVLKPGGRFTLVAGRCTTHTGKIVAPVVRAGLTLMGHRENWHYWTVHEPWARLARLSDGAITVWPRLGFQYLLCAEKPASHRDRANAN